jgi:hypothetical protein
VILCLFISVRYLRLLRSRCKNCPSPMHPDLGMFKFMIVFSTLQWVKPRVGRHSQNARQDLAISPCPKPLIWAIPLPWGFTVHVMIFLLVLMQPIHFLGLQYKVLIVITYFTCSSVSTFKGLQHGKQLRSVT